MKTFKIKQLDVWLVKVFMFLFLFIPELLSAKEKPDTISFIHLTDLHICNLAGYHPVFVEKRKHFGNGIEPFVNFIQSAPKNLNANFLVITGDVIDFYEAETSSGNMLDIEVEQFIRHLDASDVPVYMALGNHDIASYWVSSKKAYSSNQLNSARARALWIRNAPCFKNGTYYSRILTVDSTIFRLIFLDNSYYLPARTADATDFVMDPYQLYWLDNELKKSDSDIEIIFMHMPLFRIPANDMAPGRNTYYVNYQDTIPIPYELKTSKKDSLCLYSVLKNNASVKLILTGHQHSGVIHNVHVSDNYSLTHLMTGAFGYHPNNWRLIKLTGNSIIISHPGDTKKQYTIDIKSK